MYKRFRLRRAMYCAMAAVFATVSVVVLAAAQGATPVGPFAVDLTNRENVRQFWYSTHEASEGIPINWTGSIDPCNPGTVSQDFLDATLTRINYFRAMAGVPSDVTFTAENNAKAQASALIQAARNGVQPLPEPCTPAGLEVLVTVGLRRLNGEPGGGQHRPAGDRPVGARRRPGRAPAHAAQPAEHAHGIGQHSRHRCRCRG